jgi:two-component system sensor histidine kinase SenX3
VRRLRPGSGTRALQIAFLALLLFSTAQVLWGVYDQSRLASQEARGVAHLYATEARLARELLAEGRSWESVSPGLPHLELVDGNVRITQAALAAMAEARRSRLTRYGWEGTFFLVVLVACMAVVWRTLREEADLSRRQQNFIAAVSHEFKSPIASLQLSLDTIRLRRPDPARLAELVERMGGDLARLENLVTEVLDTAALESGQRELTKEAVPLAELARELAVELGARATAAGVKFQVEVGDALAADADPVAVRTVLRNLLDNALRATAAADGGRIKISSETHGNEVRLKVTDTGVGFPPEEAENLFLKFYRVGDEMRRSGSGTGLGLYIVDRLMRLEHGWARAESAGPGRGATFTVAWPRPAGRERA